MIYCLGNDLLDELASTTKQIEYDEHLAYELIRIIESNNNCLLAQSNKILNLFKEINNNGYVSENMKKAVHYCYNSFTTMYGIKNSVNNIVIITSDICKKEDSRIYLSGKYIKEHNLSLSSRIVLLTEDVSDCEFYESLCKKIINNRLNVMFRHVSGGGTEINKNLSMSVVHNRDIVYAICDSDKYHPDDEVGDTAKKLMTVVNQLESQGYYYTGYEVLEVSEKENLIKPTEYGKYLGNSIILKDLSDIEVDEDVKYYLDFFDYKAGLTKSVYEKHPEFYNKLLNKLSIDTDKVEAMHGKEAIIKGLGRTCLKKWNSECLDIGKSKFDENRLNLAKNIFSWGVSVQMQKVV